LVGIPDIERKNEMAIHRWEDLKHKASKERREEIRRKAIADLEVVEDLGSIRQIAGKTQVELAELMEKTQGEISALENREDIRLSTLRAFVKALGGRVEVLAIIGDRTVRLHSVGESQGSSPRNRRNRALV
jgi:hypothetical protein